MSPGERGESKSDIYWLTAQYNSQTATYIYTPSPSNSNQFTPVVAVKFNKHKL